MTCLVLIAVLMSLCSWTLADLCPDYYNDFVDTSEMRLMMTSPHFQCIAKCRAQFDGTQARKPALLEWVFYLKRKEIDCTAGNIKRNHHETMDKIFRYATLQQFEDLPLFFYNPEMKGTKFEAEKFCARTRLNLGMEPVGLAEFFMKKVLKPNILEPLWSSDMRYSNRTNSSECQALWISADKTLTKEVVNCKEKFGFVCTLPREWHNEVCTSRCSLNGIDFCKSEAKAETKIDCFPTCANTTCVDEEEDRYGFKPADGDLLELCDKTVLISKPMSAYKGAQAYCCGKTMQVLALETPQKRNCFKNELQKLKIANGTSFWTSGSSDKCPNSFGWCGTGDKEFIGYEQLGLESFQSAGGKECVSATLENSDLALRPENCGTKKRYICERTSNKKCKEAICPVLNCSREIIDGIRWVKIGIKGYEEYRGCNKIFNVDKASSPKATYYKAHKNICTANRVALSFHTKEKLDCVLSTFQANKAPAGKFWVSAVSMGCPSALRWCDRVTNPVIDVEKEDFLNWKKGEPSQDPLKECTMVEYKLTPPHFTFSKSDCNAVNNIISEDISRPFPI